MFNRPRPNQNFELGQQFDGLDEQTAGPPKHQSGTVRFPMAGGEFIAAEDPQEIDAGIPGRGTKQGRARGNFISQSAETVLPGEATWGTYNEIEHDESTGLGSVLGDVQNFHEGLDPQYHGQRYVTFKGQGEDPGEPPITIDSGYAGDAGRHLVDAADREMPHLALDDEVGPTVREIQRSRKEAREDQDGGLPGYSIREWNALDDEGMTRRHFE